MLVIALPQHIKRWFRSAHTWTALSILAPAGMLLVCGLMLIDLRRDAWDKAEQTSKNLLQVIERDIVRNVEIIDLTLRGVQDNLRAPGLAQLDPPTRQLVLYDRAASARDLGVLLVLDQNGDIVEDAQSVPPRKGNFADRDYFLAHKANRELGLFVGHPVVSRLTGESIVNFSRRIDKPDGAFGGLVVGSLNLSYFSQLFDQLGLGHNGAVNLFLRDGTRIIRHPFLESDIGVSIAGSRPFERFKRERVGSFVEASVRDGVRRLYTFTQVGDLPLILDVALSADEIEAEWRTKALVIGTVVLVLCGVTVALALLFGRELRWRAAAQAELARLSQTDALTGLANRRRFEEILARELEEARRTDLPLSLLVVDADHFKRFNDRYGHAIGDDVLKGLARCLAASVPNPGDAVCRVGGEEFVLVLPNTDEAAALRVAEDVHTQVSGLALGSAGIAAGSVTVSIGSATATADPHLFARADAALFKAKEMGRNRTWHASAMAEDRHGRRLLQLVARSTSAAL